MAEYREMVLGEHFSQDYHGGEPLWVCRKCGAIIKNRAQHLVWHRETIKDVKAPAPS